MYLRNHQISQNQSRKKKNVSKLIRLSLSLWSLISIFNRISWSRTYPIESHRWFYKEKHELITLIIYRHTLYVYKRTRITPYIHIYGHRVIVQPILIWSLNINRARTEQSKTEQNKWDGYKNGSTSVYRPGLAERLVCAVVVVPD